MRISDWSSDVCSSDLRRRADGPLVRVGLHDVARVIVDADEIDRLADVLEVFGRPRGPGFAEYLGQFFGIKAFQRRAEILAVHIGVRACRRGYILGAVARRIFGLDIDDEADRKSTRLNSSHYCASRMPSTA